MKAFILTIIAGTLSLFASAQNDNLYKHDGQTEDVKIAKVNENIMSYTYPGELPSLV